MAKKQLLAQLGVFLLLGLNVAAYWFLWPNYHNVSSNEGKPRPQEKGVARLVPEEPSKSAAPKEIIPSSLKDAVPLNIPVSAPQPEPKSTADQEVISKLFDHIKKESNVTQPLVTLPIVPPPNLVPFDAKPIVDTPVKLPDLPSPNPFPMLQADPLRSDNGPPTPPIAVASALTPKMLPSPWLLNMEMLGTRTHLSAKLRQPGTASVVAEFKILCDRVEMKSPGGELQALGKVTIVGTGLNAACERLTLPIHETRLVFEEHVQLAQHATAGSLLRADRITWELPPASASPVVNPIAPPNEFRPAGILPPALGVPK